MRYLLIAALAVVPMALPAQSATIYQDGRIVVRRSFPGPLPAGSSTIRLPLAEAVLSTVFPIDPGVYFGPLARIEDRSDAALLRSAVGRELPFRFYNGDTVVVRVLSANPLRLAFPSGHTIIGQPQGQLLFPAADLPATDATVRIESDRPRDQLRVGYQTTGAAWDARYTIRLRDGDDDVAGMAAVTNGDLTLTQAEVSLLSGRIGGVRPQPGAYRLDELVVTATAERARRQLPVPITESIGSHRLYRLPGRHDLRAGEEITLPLFRPTTGAIERIHMVEVGDNAVTTGTPEGIPSPVLIQYRAERPRGSEFGDQALPPGVVSIYEGERGQEVLVGEGSIQHTPPGDPLRIGAGVASEVTAQRKAGPIEGVQDSLINANGSVTVRVIAQTQTVEWTLANRSDQAITLELSDRRPGAIRVVSSNVPGDVLARNVVRFRLTIAAGEEIPVRYRLRIDR